MCLKDEDRQAINTALRNWRQGDIFLDDQLDFLHLANLSTPHSKASIQVAQSLSRSGQTVENQITPVQQETLGMVVLTQTCDIVRDCLERPFIEVAPLVRTNEQLVEEIRRLKRPAYAYIPTVADSHLVADLDRTMTVEKSIIASFKRTEGYKTDSEQRDFANALSRKRSRFAFPDDFVVAARDLQRHLIKKHNSQNDAGAYWRELQQIRICAIPSWNEAEVHLHWWFIKNNNPVAVETDWQLYIDRWLKLVDKTGRFSSHSGIACRLDDITARDYVESDRLDLDRLSVFASKT